MPYRVARITARVVLAVAIGLAALATAVSYAKGAPAPLVKNTPQQPVPKRCVMKWMSSNYVTRFNSDGSYSAKAVGYDVTWVGTWQADPKKQLLFIREKIQGESGTYLSWTIQTDPKMRCGWVGGYTFGSQPNLTLTDEK